MECPKCKGDGCEACDFEGEVCWACKLPYNRCCCDSYDDDEWWEGMTEDA